MYTYSVNNFKKQCNMKKLFYLAAAAVALAACAKNEVIPVNSGENQEITFNVAPKTKADPQAFSTNNVFASWAYYLPKDKTWEANWKEATEYIEGSTISYVGDVWKNKDITYAWPHEGSLTFFAYSLNSNKLTDPSVHGESFLYCEKFDAGTDPKKNDQYGITGQIDLDANNNVDFLVADIASDKTANDTKYNFNGVPTLFRHRLSKVKFAITKKSNYPNTTITLNSITFNNLSHAMHYIQFQKDKVTNKFQEVANPSGSRTSQVYTSSNVEVTSTNDPVAIADEKEVRYIYIPQVFAGVTGEENIATIDIVYTVNQVIGNNTITKQYTKNLKVMSMFDSWEMGKKYTINLTFTLDEILWAPAVEDWADGTTAGQTVA